jgi:hypothetical protein
MQLTDNQLAVFLCIPVSLVSKIDPVKRKVYEALAKLELDIQLWQTGLAPKPDYAIIDEPRRKNRRSHKVVPGKPQ